MTTKLRDLVAEQNPVVKILGWSDDICECQHCGRTDLKGTLVCEHANGAISYMGSVCGVHAYRWGKSLEKWEDAKFARQLEKMAHDADRQRRLEACRALGDHPLYKRARDLYTQRCALNLKPGLESLHHPLTREYQALEAQAKAEVMAQFGVKAIPISMVRW